MSNIVLRDASASKNMTLFCVMVIFFPEVWPVGTKSWISSKCKAHQGLAPSSLHLDHPQPCEMISFSSCSSFTLKNIHILCCVCIVPNLHILFRSVRPINVWPPPQSPPSSTTPTPPSPPSSFLRGKLSTRTYCSRRKWRWFIKKKKMFYWNPTIICHCHSFSNFPASA